MDSLDERYNPSFVLKALQQQPKIYLIVLFSLQEQGRFIVGGISPGTSVGAAGGWRTQFLFPPKSGLGTPSSFPNPIYPHILTFDLGVDNVLQFISPTDLSSPPIHSSTQICFGRYTVVHLNFKYIPNSSNFPLNFGSHN